MGKNDTDASQRSETTTSNYDNRVANESGIAIGAGGQYINEFSPQVVDVVSAVLDFTGDVLNSSESFLDRNTSLAQSLVQSNKEITSQQQLGSASLIKDVIPVLMIGAIGLLIFLGFKK